MSWQAEMLGIDMEDLREEAMRHYFRDEPVVVNPPLADDETWVSLPTGAHLLRYTQDTVRRYAKQGIIRSVKLSGRLFVNENDCRRLRRERDGLSA